MRLAAVNAWLARRASDEAASRQLRYPQAVADGKIERDDAETDLAAWKLIAALFAEGSAEAIAEVRLDGEPRRIELGWPSLELAASRALIRANAVVERRPDDGELLHRRDAIQAIHARLAIHRDLFAPPAKAGEETRAA
jgi:hypothetical protein